MKLPAEEESHKTVYLPNNEQLITPKKALLSFPQLTKKAREADILQGLKQKLVSINKLAEKGYTTVFHPEDKGITVHKKGTLTINTMKAPVLQGCKQTREKLWSVTMANNEQEVNNVYDLPTTPQTILYLNAAAGYPVKDTWIKAIKHNNFITWPGLMPEAARINYPNSNKTQKGHMKQQCQNVRSTKVRMETVNKEDEEPIPELSTYPDPLVNEV
jgi:hypothetical protein